MKRKAFTLIELLVVIAIIALLLSVLVPSLKKAKEGARGAVCKANLHQWGIAWKTFVDSNKGRFCNVAEVGMDTDMPRGSWIFALREYMGHDRRKLLICPSAALDNPAGGTAGNVNYTYQMTAASGTSASDPAEKCSYGANVWIYNYTGTKIIQGRDPKNHWNTMDQNGSSRIPMMLDSMWRGGSPQWGTGVHTTNDINAQQALPAAKNSTSNQVINFNAANEMAHFCIDRHSKAINSVFMDISVSPVPLKRLWSLRWHRNFAPLGWQSAWDNRTEYLWLKSFDK